MFFTRILTAALFETRGNAPRIYRNTLIFLAADKTRLQDLDEAARKFLAWESILDEKDELGLSPHQVRQAEIQKTAADAAVTARLPETYQWLLVPAQASPQAPVTWQTVRLSGNGGLATRASKKLKSDELLVLNFAASRLRMELDRVPLWRGNHVPIRQLAEDFGRYLYLPRLQKTEVPPVPIPGGTDDTTPDDPTRPKPPVDPVPPNPSSKPKRYHGTVILDSARVGRDAGKIAEEVVGHLVGLVGSSVKVTLEIEAEIPGGASDNVVRTVTENSRTLKFTSSGFETE